MSEQASSPITITPAGALKSPVEPVPAQEAPPTTTSAPEAQPKADVERWAQLARKEKALRAETKKIQAMKAEIDQQRAKPAEPVDWKSQFLKDPYSVGVTPEELQQITLNSMNQSPEAVMIRQLQAKIEALEAGQSTVLKKTEEAQTSAYNNAIKQLNREVGLLVDGDEIYETIKATGSQEAVVALIESTYKEDGILLTAEEAAKQVEDYLLEEAVTLSNLKKVKARLAPEAASLETTQKQSLTQKPQPKTLTNDMTSQSKPLSQKDRRARAIAAFQNKLNG